MAIWDDILTEHDRMVIAAKPARPRTGFGERPALLVIDMNRGVVGENRPIYEQTDKYPYTCGPFAWAAIPHIQTLISNARDASIPIIYSKHVFKLTDGLPRSKDLNFPHHELNPLSEIQPEVAMQDGDLLIEKNTPSVFFHTGLIYILLHKKIDTLLIAGNSTSGCVRATVIDAFGYGFKTSVIEECVFDRIEASHKMSLFDMNTKYADVIPLSDALTHLATFKNGEREPELTAQTAS